MKNIFLVWASLILGAVFFVTGCDLAGTGAAVLTIQISAPANNARVFSNFTVSGTVAGPYRITNMVVEFQAENGDSQSKSVGITSSSNFSASFTVSNLGIYNVWAHTEDTGGNSGSTATNRFLVTEDASVILLLNSPTNNQEVASNFTVSGNIGGTSTVTQINIFALRKTGSTTYSSTTNTTNVTISGIDFSGSFIFNQYGSYLIWASALVSSNQTTNSERVLVQVVDDTVTLSITNPTTNLGITVTNVSNITISGTVDLNFGSVDGVYVTLSNSSGTLYRAASGIVNWSYSLAAVLKSGSNFVQVDALSPAGTAVSSGNIWMVYDESGPTNILSFTNNQIYTNTTVTLAGTSSDSESGVQEVFLSLTNAAFQSAGLSGSWSTNLTLSEGTYSVRVYSKNNAGVCSRTNSLEIDRYDQAVYVSLTGSDSAKGTKNQPVLSLQSAISRAVAVGITEIRVQSGTYEPGNGLNANQTGVILTNNNITLSGGWNSGFSTRTAHSVLSGKGLLTTIVSITSVTNIQIDGFDIIGGRNTSGQGAGIYASGVTEFLLANSLLSNHSAQYGGAIYLSGSTNVSLTGVGSSLVIRESQAGQDGGGIYITGGTNYALNNLTLYNCNAANAGGGVYANDAQALAILSGVFTNSYAGSDNAVIYVKGAGVDVSLKINGNTIGGNGTSGYGVFEGDEVNGLELKNNTFLKTSGHLGYFYRDPSYGDITSIVNLTEANIDGASGQVTGNTDL